MMEKSDLSALSTLSFLEPINKYMNIKGDMSAPISALYVIDGATYLYDDLQEAYEYGRLPFANVSTNSDAQTDSDQRQSIHAVSITFFRRMPPETEVEENTRIIQQPYFNNYNRKYYFAHGLFSNALSFVPNAYVDTEILGYLPNPSNLLRKQAIEGKYVVFEVSPENNSTRIYNNSGLGVWFLDPAQLFGADYRRLPQSLRYLTIVGTSRVTDVNNTAIEHDIDKSHHVHRKEIVVTPNTIEDEQVSKAKQSTPKRIAYALYSGGLDITATCKILKKTNPNVHIIGVYVDWGTQASVGERKAIERAKDRKIIDESRIVSAEHFMDEWMRLNNGDTTLYNNEGEGIKEAETTRAYVPYRNTLFLTLLASMIENDNRRKEYDETLILIGANLSEGMAYNDNSLAFIEHIEHVLNLGGKDTYFYKLYAPFVNKTKTEMLSYFTQDEIDEIFDASFSCYYPNEEGEPCGKCGSCYLRQKAYERAIERSK